MRMDKLTTKFQQALADAQSLAVGRDNQYIEPVHLMVALLDQQGGTARPLLEKAGVQVPKLRSDLAAALERIARVRGAGGEVLPGNDLTNLLMSPTSWRSSAAISSFPANCSCWLRAMTGASWAGCSRPTARHAPIWRRPSRKCAAAPRWTMRAPKKIARRWRSTALT